MLPEDKNALHDFLPRGQNVIPSCDKDILVSKNSEECPANHIPCWGKIFYIACMSYKLIVCE